MITESGKKFIAHNFGVNDCYALDSLVSCSLFIDGELIKRTLSTAALLTALTSGMADYVITPTGEFRIAQLRAANDDVDVTLWDSMIDEPYCITEPVVTEPGPPTVSIQDVEIVNPSVNCDSSKCYARFDLKNNSSSGSVYVRLDVDGAPKYKRSVYLLGGATKPQVLSSSITDLSAGYHNLTIVVGKVTDTDTYTHRFLVGAGIEPPPTTAKSLSAAEFVAEIRRRGTLDLAGIPMIPQDNTWFRFAGQVVYRMAGGKGGIALINPGKSNMFAAFSKDDRTVTQVEKNWAMARIAELPFTAAPVAAKITKAGLIDELRRRGAIDIAAVSTTAGANKWYMYYGRLSWHTANFEMGMEIRNLQTRNPPTQVSDISLTENKMTPLAGLDRSWVLARIAELPFTAAPTATGIPGVTIAVDKATCRVNETIYLTGQYIGGNGLPVVGHNIRFHSFINSTRTQIGSKKTQANGMYIFPYVPMVAGSWEFEAFNDYTSPKITVTVTPLVTPPAITEPPEAIKNWVATNYGDGTRVTSDSADKLMDAMAINALAPLPTGYTKADITQDVWKWARNNVGYTVVVDFCGWIEHEGVKNLKRDHARYIYSTAIVWTDAAETYYNQITPRPERIPVDLATKDNARAVYSYSIGWYDAGNTYSGCNLKE